MGLTSKNLTTLSLTSKNLTTLALTSMCPTPRIGAITGIILGDYNLFHLFTPVLILAGTLALFSSILVPFLPDMTKQKMAKTYQDIQKVQFPNSSGSLESNVTISTVP